MLQRVITMLVIVVIVLGGGYYAYQQLVPPPVQEAQGPTYSTQPVTKGDITVGVDASGPINPSRGGGIQIPWSERGQANYVIAEVLAQSGDHVEQGQVVIRLQAVGLDDQIKAKEMEVQSYKESLAKLLNVSPEEIDQLGSISGITVTAPIAGRISGLAAKDGEKLEKDSIIARIVDDSEFRIVARVTPGVFKSVSMDQPVQLRFPQFDGLVNAKVVDINPDAVPESRASLETDCSDPTPSGPADEYTMVYWVTIQGKNPGLVQPDMRVQPGFVGDNGTTWTYYCSRVEGFGAEQTILSPTDAVATKVFVHDRETVKAGDPLVSLAGDDARSNIQEQLGHLRDLQMELNDLYNQRTSLDIKAPMTGIIADLSAEVGQSAQTGQWFGSVYTTEMMNMWVQVDDVDVLLVKQGAPVDVTVDAAPGKHFEGTVTYISQMGQDQSGIVQFGVSIDVVGGPEMRPGMQGQAHIDAGSAEGVLLAPLEAIFEEDGQPKVEVLNADGTTKVVPVELGLMNDRVAEVRSGLEEGELVITGSSADLLPSQKIQSNDTVFPGAPDDSTPTNSGSSTRPVNPK